MAADNPIDFSKYIGGEEALKGAARSVRSLKTDVAALSKSVDGDAGRIQAGFARIAEAVKAVQEKATRLNLFSPADKKLLDEYTAQIANLSKANADLKATQRAQTDIQKGLSDVTRQYTSELAKQKDALRAAALANDEEGQRKAAAAIRQTTLETTQLSKALRGANSEFTAAKGSYDALVLENNKLLASLHALEGGLNSGSQEALRLKRQIFDNTETLKNFDLETNRSFRNVGNYAQSFSGLIAELAKARTAQAAYSEGSADAARNQLRITGFQTAAQRAAANMGLSYEQAEAKIAGVTSAIQPLVTNLVRLEKEQEAIAVSAGKDSEAYRRIGFEIQATSKKVDTLAASTAEATSNTGDFTEQLGFNRAGLTQFAAGLVAGAVGFQAILSGVNAVFQANVVLSDSLADVRKTTGLTADETDRLVSSLKGLDTRTSLAGLLDIAKVGGQLGIAKDEIFAFTKAVDTGVQALGDDFQGGAEQIATELGKISLVFKNELGSDQAQNLLAIGSAVNQIGADGAATAPFLTDVALRVGAVASQAGVGLKNVLAYAAVLQETGFTAEVSGTALNKLFNTLSTKTTEAFRIARNANPALTLQEFTRLVNTDFNAAIQLFLKGLNAGGKTTTALAAELATLKLKGGEAQSVMVTLAQNTDLFADRQRTANDQLRDATSLAAEAAIKNDTLAGSTNKLTNNVSNFFTSGAAGRFIKFFVDLKNAELGAAGNLLDKLGDSIGRLAQKAGLAEKPQEDFTVKIVGTVQALEKQAGAQQALLTSYTTLAATSNRTEGQRLELAQLRAKLIAQFGTDEADVIQQRINGDLLAAESYKKTLRSDLAAYDQSTRELLGKQATYQEALNKQEGRLSAQQRARAKEVAQAGLEAERRTGQPFRVNPFTVGRELEPAIAANLRLLKTEQDLATQQRTRSNLVAALAKLTPTATKAAQDAADANDDEASSIEELDRAGRERAKNRVEQLKDELAANQKRIADLKAYMAEQGKLLEAGQLDRAVFAQRAAGAEDLLTQLQRNGEAVRIRLVRAESAEKLKEADNDRIRQRNKKNISEAELADIQEQYALRRIAIARAEKREIAKIQDERADAIKVDPIEFIAPLDTKSFEKEMKEVGRIRQRGFDQQERQVDEAGKKLQHQLDEEVRQVKEAEQRKKDLRAKGAEVAVALVDGLFQAQRTSLEGQQAAEQYRYDQSIKNAGENAELRAAIDAEHEKKDLALRQRQAKNDRQQAIFSILVKLAEATMTELGRYGLPFALPFIAGDAALAGIQLANLPPIPQFFKGVRGLKADVPLATVAEKGPELVHEKATGKFRYHATPAFTTLGKGDDVYTAEETRQLLAGDMRALQQPLGFGSSLASATATLQAGRAQASHAGELREIRQAMHENTAVMKNLKQVTLNVNGEVTGALVQHGDSLTRSLNQRLLNYGS